jgi:hypothetical protein
MQNKIDNPPSINTIGHSRPNNRIDPFHPSLAHSPLPPLNTGSPHDSPGLAPPPQGRQAFTSTLKE